MKKVMIVDDNKDVANILKLIMEKSGYLAEISHCGEEFLTKLDNFNPDIVLLDIMMPGMTTKEIITELEKKGAEKLKIILVTVIRFSEEEVELLLNKALIVDYVTKPFDVSELIKRVNRAVA